MCCFVCKALKKMKVVPSTVSPPLLRAELILVQRTTTFDVWVERTNKEMILKLVLLVKNAKLKKWEEETN